MSRPALIFGAPDQRVSTGPKDAPMSFYVAVHHRSFGSINALCRGLGIEPAFVRDFLDHARFHRSDLVVIPPLVLGDAEHKVCAGLLIGPGGAVKLMACYFGEASTDRAEVEAFAKQLAAHPEFAKRSMFIASFRPDISRELPQ